MEQLREGFHRRNGVGRFPAGDIKMAFDFEIADSDFFEFAALQALFGGKTAAKSKAQPCGYGCQHAVGGADRNIRSEIFDRKP